MAGLWFRFLPDPNNGVVRKPRLVLPPKRQALPDSQTARMKLINGSCIAYGPTNSANGVQSSGPTSSSKVSTSSANPTPPKNRPKPTSANMLDPKKGDDIKDWTNSTDWWSDWSSEWSDSTATERLCPKPTSVNMQDSKNGDDRKDWTNSSNWWSDWSSELSDSTPTERLRPKPTSVNMLDPKKKYDRKDWTNSSNWWSDWPSDGMWSSWNSKEQWVQDERHKENNIEIDTRQNAISWEKELSAAYADMELDLASDKEALSVDYKEDPNGKWCNLLRTWDDEKTTKFQELALSETCCREVQNDEDESEYEWIREEMNNDNEELIKRTREVLQRNLGKASLLPPYPPSKQVRMGRSGKAGSRRAKARERKMDDNRVFSSARVSELRFSQESCKDTFTCGRSVMQLVDDLLQRKVSLSAAFLRLTAYEDIDKETNEPILRCVDNRRLFALKEYAKRSRKNHVMVNIELFSANTIKQVQRMLRNSDDTDGRAVRLRTNNGSNKQRQPRKGRKRKRT